MWSRLLVGLSIAGGLCGFAALLSLFHLIPVETIVSVNKVEYIYEKLSLHMWFLEVILLIAGLAATVLGFVGYQSVKEEAVKQAIEKARQETLAYLDTVQFHDSDTELRSVDYQIRPDPTGEEVR